jgi:hypothetical protein
MPNRRSKRTRRTKAQWFKILERFPLSDQDARQFCRREGLALGSLQRWRRQLGTVAQRERFVEVVPVPSIYLAEQWWAQGITTRFGHAAAR